MEVFNPYQGMGPPQCCYCAPLAEPGAVSIEVQTSIEGGFGNLAFMTRTEDAFRILEQGREAERLGLVDLIPSVSEQGFGPYSFTRTSPPAG